MNVSQITEYLFVGAEPQAMHFDELCARNVRLIISMIGAHRPPEAFGQPPCQLLWLETYDTILTPIPIGRLMQGVRMALPVIQGGGSVLVYCRQGRHRSVAMAAAILIAMGHPANEAMHLIRSRRRVADPHARHIRRQILEFERRWPGWEDGQGASHQGLGDVYCESTTALISRLAVRLGLGRGPLARFF